MLRFSKPLINVLICADDQCKVDCRAWTTTFGQCSSNSIIDGGIITFYSDSNCSTIIPGSDNIPVLLSGDCNVLLSNIYSQHIGSYKVTQTSPYIQIIALFIISFLFCCCSFCCCLCYVTKTARVIIPAGPIGPATATATATATAPTATAPTGPIGPTAPLLHDSEDPQ